MIIGDPYSFAILAKKINSWNTDSTFNNGILLFYVNGELYPKEIINTTLSSELYNVNQAFDNIKINTELYYAEKNIAYKKIYDITYPENWDLDNDYSYDITPQSFSDQNYYIFAVSNGKKIRILASKLDYDFEISRHNFININISEIYIDCHIWEDCKKKIDFYVQELTKGKDI